MSLGNYFLLEDGHMNSSKTSGKYAFHLNIFYRKKLPSTCSHVKKLHFTASYVFV
jgi:hypothetical protein